jgi:biotin--protein ligase
MKLMPFQIETPLHSSFCSCRFIGFLTFLFSSYQGQKVFARFRKFTRNQAVQRNLSYWSFNNNDMNVLIYNGNGTSANAVKQTYTTLKAILGHAYDVMKVDATTLKDEPWQETCSLFVMPGGRDSPYCDDLNGPANAKIREFVQGGGRYLGFCAGAYYASNEIEFEKGSAIQVVGQRELGFFPGLSRGTMFPGFVYNSEKGARSVSIRLNESQKSIKTYYNGGGYFVHADKYDNVKVICTYQDRGLAPETEPAAGVHCQVGKGTAVLFGVHPEYDISLVDLSENENKNEILKELMASLPLCRDLLSQSLSAMGLNTLQNANKVPDLTPVYLSTVSGDLLQAITQKLSVEVNDSSLLTDSNDSFYIAPIEKNCALSEMLQNLSLERESEDKSPVLKILFPTLTNKDTPQVPERSLTPLFDLQLYFDALLARRKQEWGGGSWYRIGNAMLYSEVITSTQTILDK